MKLITYGVTAETVASDELARYFLTRCEKNKQLQTIKEFAGVQEVFILTMADRLEYYLYVDETVFEHGQFLRFLSRYADKDLDEVILETSSKFNEDGVKHLIEVAAGFLSDSFGDLKAFYDVERNYNFARESGDLGPVFEYVLERIIRFVHQLKQDDAYGVLYHDPLTSVFNHVQSLWNELETKHLLFIGAPAQLAELVAVFRLEHPPASLTVVTKDQASLAAYQEKRRQLTPFLEETPMLEYALTVDQVAYRLAKADVIVLLETFDGISPADVQVTAEVRQTNKKTWVLDLVNSDKSKQLKKLLTADNLVVDENPSISSEEKDNALHILDEVIDIEIQQLMKKLI